MQKYRVEVDRDKATRWYKHNTKELHRENGPAVELASSAKFWYINNKLHRENGPACEYSDGDKCWYINGRRLTEEQFNNRNSCEGKTVIVDGVEYELKAKQ